MSGLSLRPGRGAGALRRGGGRERRELTQVQMMIGLVVAVVGAVVGTVVALIVLTIIIGAAGGH